MAGELVRLRYTIFVHLRFQDRAMKPRTLTFEKLDAHGQFGGHSKVRILPKNRHKIILSVGDESRMLSSSCFDKRLIARLVQLLP